MPVTPLHFGPALLIALLVYPSGSVIAFAAGSVAPDAEHAVHLLIGQPVTHRELHNIAGALAIGALTAALVWLFRGPLMKLQQIALIPQEYTPAGVAASAILGALSHVILDAFLYPELPLLWPFTGNPLLGIIPEDHVYALCITTFPVVIFLYAYMVTIPRWKKR